VSQQAVEVAKPSTLGRQRSSIVGLMSICWHGCLIGKPSDTTEWNDLWQWMVYLKWSGRPTFVSASITHWQ